MNESIFSTYHTGENRVTASILAVLRCLALPRIEGILGALTNTDFQLVQFVNQAGKGGKGVPDARISSSCRLLLETKLVRNSLDRNQLERHLERLDSTNEKDRMVLALTPDDVQPELITTINNPRLVWNSFVALNQAIDEMLSEKNEKEVVSEREEFLLRELQKMLLAENLLGSSKGVVVIPARNAWPLYQEVHAYICQPGRAFQQVKYIAFYADNKIYPLVPLILELHDQVIFERGKYPGRLGKLVNQTIELGEKPYWPYKLTVNKVFLLSAPDAPETVKLDQPIVNDLKSSGEQRIAFTQNQRYVSLDALRTAKKTSELKDE